MNRTTVMRRAPHHGSRSRLRAAASMLVLSGLAALSGAAHADTLINFDELTIGDAVANQYVAQGVQFNGVKGFPGRGAHASNDVTPHSGNVALIENPFALELASGPLTFTFLTPQKTVQLFGGYVKFVSDPPTTQGTLRGFDAGGRQVAIDGAKPVTGGQASTPFSLSSTQANITKVVFDAGPTMYAVIDDLQFGGGAAIVPPSGSPVVTITDPAATFNDAVDAPLAVSGSVTGQGLLPTVTVTLQLLNPPPLPGFPATRSAEMPLVFSDANHAVFDNRLAPGNATFGTLLLGMYTLTVTATNLAGVTTTSSVTFLNLPPIVAFFALTGQLGGFQFAEATGGCQIAVFDVGALAYFPATASFIGIPTPIANKWFAVQADLSSGGILGGDRTLGCPIAAATPGTVPPPSKVIPGLQTQDFERGRIYAPASGPAVYTPAVFVNAITTVSTLADADAPQELVDYNDPLGTTEVGIPFADPVFDLSGDNPTWLFQRFARPGFVGEANTLEIRGRPEIAPGLRLYLERVGGSVVDFAQIQRRLDSINPNPGQPTPTPPTVWESYGCNLTAPGAPQGQYACDVSRPHLQALVPRTPPVPIYTTTSQIADLDHFCSPLIAQLAGNGTWWSAIPNKTRDPSNLDDLSDEPTPSDNIAIKTSGWVEQSERAGHDFAPVHRHMHYTDLGQASRLIFDGPGCFFLGDFTFGCTNTPGPLVGDGIASELGGWADWSMKIRPLALQTDDPNAASLRLPTPPPNQPPPPEAPALWNLLASNADPSLDGQADNEAGLMEAEWENDWQPWTILQGMHAPAIGSLAILNGRWILDCGHSPYHSEIHPPNTVITLESAPPPPGTFPTAHRDNSAMHVTRAQVWMNEFYQGDLFTTTIWAPPRPSPDAQLGVVFNSFNPLVQNADGSFTYTFFNVEVDGGPAIDASTANIHFAPDGLAVSVSGPHGNHHIDGTGQVIWPSDDIPSASGTVGTLTGLWYVAWNQ